MKTVFLDSKTLGRYIDLSPFDKFDDIEIFETTSKDEVVERIKDAEIVIVNKVELNETNLIFAPKVKLISLTATGTNNINLEYAKQQKIAVTNVAGYSTQSVAQHTFAMLLYLYEHLNFYDNYVKSNEYSKSDTFCNIDKSFFEIDGKTWGIIGLGAIGSKVAKIAQSFGCNILYYSTSGKNNNNNYKRVELNELLKSSDIVSIHAPLDKLTENLIDLDELKMMKKDAVLLNLGRGGIVNEKSLAYALDEGFIAAAGLDVLKSEPIEKENPLLKIKDPERLLITPHMAWGSVEARERLVCEILNNIESFKKGEKRNRVI